MSKKRRQDSAVALGKKQEKGDGRERKAVKKEKQLFRPPTQFGKDKRETAS